MIKYYRGYNFHKNHTVEAATTEERKRMIVGSILMAVALVASVYFSK